MEGLASKYADDQEAQIFYALALAAAEEPTDKTYAARLKAARSWRSYSAKNRTIPGWRITSFTPTTCRLWRERRLSPLGVIPISRLMRHTRCICRHTRSRVSATGRIHRQQPRRSRASRRVGQTAEELHASDYQVYAYLQTAQDEAARRCSRRCRR